MCVLQPQVLPDNSQPTPVGGDRLVFLLLSSLGTLRENAPAQDLFLFEETAGGFMYLVSPLYGSSLLC